MTWCRVFCLACLFCRVTDVVCISTTKTPVSTSSTLSRIFQRPCVGDSRLIGTQMKEENTRTALECAALCLGSTTIGLLPLTDTCYGFNYCRSTKTCEMIMGHSHNVTKLGNCMHVSTTMACIYYEVQTGMAIGNDDTTNGDSVTTDENVFDLNSTCEKCAFENVFEINSSAPSSDISTLKGHVENGSEISIMLMNWNGGEQLLLRADLAVSYEDTEKICAQSLWNLDWDETLGQVNQTLFIICTDSGVTLQKWQLGRRNKLVESLQVSDQAMIWFSSDRARYNIDHTNASIIEAAYQNGFSFGVKFRDRDEPFSTAFTFTNVAYYPTGNGQFLLSGQFPWCVSWLTTSQEYKFDDPDLYWYSMLLTGSNMYHVSKWLVTSRVRTYSLGKQYSSAVYTWKVDPCWKFVFENEGASHKEGNVGDLITYIKQGRPIRYSAQPTNGHRILDDPVALCIFNNTVVALDNMALELSSTIYKYAMERLINIYSTNRSSKRYTLPIGYSITPIAEENDLLVKWYVDLTDWKQIYSTDMFFAGVPLQQSFSDALNYGATVRVQIQTARFDLFMTVNNVVYSASDQSIVASAVNIVELKVESNDVSLTTEATSEFFRLYVNGTVVVSHFTYETMEFVDSVIMHQVPIKWFVNSK